jgi:hypothetical protein
MAFVLMNQFHQNPRSRTDHRPDHYWSEAIVKRQAKSVRSRTDPPADLTGRRFGKWTVLKYAGQRIRYYRGWRFSKRMWLCRCDCGVQKEVPHHNLTEGLSRQCQQCFRNRHGISSTGLYGRWRRMGKSGQLPKEWQDFDVFRKDVGDPPCKNAWLARYDGTRPHSSQNTFWMYPGFSEKDPASFNALKLLRKKAAKEHVAHDKMLLQIGNAKDRKERNRCMIAAREAGYTLGLIGMAAKLTSERVRVITTRGW